ncbi:MAG: hypothetical protein RIB43_14490 [Rhodospirillaceae bacterium]
MLFPIDLDSYRSNSNRAAIRSRRARHHERECERGIVGEIDGEIEVKVLGELAPKSHRIREKEFESLLLNRHAETLESVMSKVKHYLGLYEKMAQVQAPQCDLLIASVFADLHRLSDAAEKQS